MSKKKINKSSLDTLLIPILKRTLPQFTPVFIQGVQMQQPQVINFQVKYTYISYTSILIEKIFNLKYTSKLFKQECKVLGREILSNLATSNENIYPEDMEEFYVLMNYLFLKRNKHPLHREFLSDTIPIYEDLLFLFKNKSKNKKFLRKLLLARKLIS
jgi:hypothetical protein